MSVLDENPGKHSDHESYSERAGTVSFGNTISKNNNGRKCISQIPGACSLLNNFYSLHFETKILTKIVG